MIEDIFQSIAPNEKRYLLETCGHLINMALKELLQKSKDCGHYYHHLKENGVEEEKEYSMQKNDLDDGSSHRNISKSRFNPIETLGQTFLELKDKDLFNNSARPARNSTFRPGAGGGPPGTGYVRRKRGAVFAEVKPVTATEELPFYPKDAADQAKLDKVLGNNMITEKLSEDAKRKLVGAMYKRTYNERDVIIQYGDMGEEYYVLHEGFVECLLYDQSGSEVLLKKTLPRDACFGELGLLYNSRRSATILASTPSTVWVISGPVFRSVIMAAQMETRNKRLQFLDRVDLFKNIGRY